MGPLIDEASVARVTKAIEAGVETGAELLLDGRKAKLPGAGFVGPTIFDHVPHDSALAMEEIFGPVLSILRVETLEDAIAVTQRSPYGNMAVMFTDSGYAANKFKDTAGAGMIGINVGVPAPMAVFPILWLERFVLWNASLKWRRCRSFLHRGSHNCEPMVLKGQLWHV